MARLIFRLRNVPDDEAADVRALLVENDIEFYETGYGLLGISVPGIWLRNDDDYDLAVSLLNRYQQERSAQARADYQARQRAGTADTWASLLSREPAKGIGALLLVLFILFVSISAFY